MALHPSDSLVSFEDEVTAPLLPVSARPALPSRPYISLRWRLLLPITIVVLLVVAGGAYLVSGSLTADYDEKDSAELLAASQRIATETLQLGDHHRREIFRLMNTRGVRENIARQDGAALQPLIEPNALLADLDLVIVTTADGHELIGLQRVVTGDLGNEAVDYTIATATDLSSISALTAVLSGDLQHTDAILRTGRGLVLVSAEPVYSPAKRVMGVLIVGTRLDHTLTHLQTEAIDLAVFGARGEVLRTTLPDTADVLRQLSLSGPFLDEVLARPDHTPLQIQNIAGARYQVAYLPFVIDTMPVGVLAVYRPTSTPFVTTTARQIFSLVAALIAASVVIVGYIAIIHIVARLEQVRATATALAAGQPHSRTHMPPADEIGQLATALDHYADSIQQRTDHLVTFLQRQQHETARLTAIIENIPDGLVILDPDGRVLMMNSAARRLIGGISTWHKENFHQLAAVATATLGSALAPGLYALGDPTRIPYGEKVLQTQTAVVLSTTGKTLGVVITLRNITPDVQREQRYESLLEELARDVQLPIAHVAQDAALLAANQRRYLTGDSLLAFARQIARNARAMQRILAELREINTFNPQDVERGQAPLLVSNLLWQIAAQWKPAAAAARIDLVIHSPATLCYILGDERRLRWAIGNVVDNAIKYSRAGTTITMSGQETAEGAAHIQVADEGVGITPEDLPHIFKRFYRGKPPLLETRGIAPPGAGQGLFLAQKIIEAHGGQMAVESEPGHGTAVHFWLPLTAPVTLEMPDEATAPLSASFITTDSIASAALPLQQSPENP